MKKRQEVKTPQAKIKAKVGAKVAEAKKEEIIEITDKFKIADLEKHGFVVTAVRSEIKGERPKTWILRKEIA